MIGKVAAAFAALMLLPGAAPADPAVAFGQRESVQDIRLSPDGAKIAYVAPAPQGQASALYTVDLASGVSVVTTRVDGRSQRLGGCNWVSNSRLVCAVWAVAKLEGQPVGVSRLVALDSDGRNVEALVQQESLYQRYNPLHDGGVIDWLPGSDGTVLMAQVFVPELRTGTNLARKENGLGVVRVDTRSPGKRSIIVDPKLNAVEYISDGRGVVRIMGTRADRGATGMLGNQISYFYRTGSSGEWRPFGKYDVLTREGLNPYAVDATLNAAYAFEKLNGRAALYRVALDGSHRKELLASHDQVDIDALISIGRAGRVVGASYATDRRRAIYFDPSFKALSASLSKALPGNPMIRFVDASEDESKLLIWAGSDTDPGRYFIYDKTAKKMADIMLSRPQLEEVKLATVKSVAYRAADGTMVPGYLTLPPGSGKGLPAIVMPHGGPGARDEWGFDWLAQFYANRGFVVLQPNFRGSAGYGDAWFQENGFQSWRTAVGDVNDAGRWLAKEGIADPDKLAVVGWSYGGYAALQSGVLDPALFKAVVAIAPVTDLNALKEESRGWTSFAMMRDFIGSGAHIKEGSPAQNAAAIKAPVLLFHGELDSNVGIRQSRLMRDRLKDAGRKVELVAYPGLDHGLDDSAARADMLRRSETFLKATLGL